MILERREPNMEERQTLMADFPHLVPEVVRILAGDASVDIRRMAVQTLCTLAQSDDEIAALRSRLQPSAPVSISDKDAAALNAFQAATGTRIDPIDWLALINMGRRAVENRVLVRDACMKVMKTVWPIVPLRKQRMFRTADHTFTFTFNPDDENYLNIDGTDYSMKSVTSMPFDVQFACIEASQELLRKVRAHELDSINGKCLPQIESGSTLSVLPGEVNVVPRSPTRGELS
ncbi:MAG: hypothetical protein ACP5OR_03615 [Candidatus Dormibacteria bacterium]